MLGEVGQKVSFALRLQTVGRSEARVIPVHCVAPSGKDVVLMLESGGTTNLVYGFVPEEKGAYRIHCEPGGLTAELIKSSAPACLLGERGRLHLLSTTGDFYFWVPKGVSAFAIKLTGEGSGERVQATLFDPQNRLVQHQDNIAEAMQMLRELPAPSEGGAWRLKLERPTQNIMEDYFVELQGLPPWLASSPEALLRPQ